VTLEELFAKTEDGYADTHAIAHYARAMVLLEREACAMIADRRAAICREAMDGPPDSLPHVEVHTMNEALHIATMIRNRT
jgi:hypothetical protein